MLAFCCNLFSENPPIERQVESYLKGLKFVSAEFDQVTSSGETYSGSFWMSKKKGTEVRIAYKTGLNQDIFISGTSVTICEKNSKKEYRYSISQTPIYSILSGGIDLSKEKFEIIENSKEFLRLKLIKSSAFGGITVTLVFSKYEKSGNVKNLVAWIIDDGKTETLFSFDESSLFVNDEKKIPNGIFEKTKGK